MKEEAILMTFEVIYLWRALPNCSKETKEKIIEMLKGEHGPVVSEMWNLERQRCFCKSSHIFLYVPILHQGCTEYWYRYQYRTNTSIFGGIRIGTW